MATNIQEIPPLGTTTEKTMIDPEKDAGTENSSQVHDHHDDSDAKSEEFQGGVQRVRAVTALWTKKTLWLMFSL